MIIQPRKLKKIEDEIWREVPKSNNRYHVSNYGRVKSFAYNKTDGQILKYSVTRGFKAVQLNFNNVKNKFCIHKLVAQIWVPRPSEAHTAVTHVDRNLTNNHISNLKWITEEERRRLTGEFNKVLRADPKRQKFIANSKLKERDVVLLKSMLQRGVTQAKIAQLFSISEMQVTRIKRGENWGHIVV